MSEFGAIPVFVAVVENGGFSPAARVLGISKSAISKRISLLEKQLGVKLLHRTTRKLSLTEAGEHYLEHATKALSAARDAEEAVTQLQGEPQGRLRITAPMSLGRLHVAPMIPKFLARYPKINIDMILDDKLVDLVAGGFDVAIRAFEQEDSNLVARKLTFARSVICASPGYIKIHGKPETPADLLDHNCLMFSYSNYSNQMKEWTLINELKTETVIVSGNYQVNNSESLREAVLQGLGIGRLPTFIAGPDLKSKRLINLFESYRMLNVPIYATFIEREYMPAKLRVFLDFVVDYFGGDEPYWDV